ncbi:hypothetical protein ACTZWT_06830 [Rhodopseudomonas sp. NSM]
MSDDDRHLSVMAGLVPAIHVLPRSEAEGVDARDKRGHDVVKGSCQLPLAANGQHHA